MDNGGFQGRILISHGKFYRKKYHKKSHSICIKAMKPSNPHKIPITSQPGWWFGTWMDYDFPIILGFSSSQLTKSIIFQRGRSTTNPIPIWSSWGASCGFLGMNGDYTNFWKLDESDDEFSFFPFSFTNSDQEWWMEDKNSFFVEPKTETKKNLGKTICEIYHLNFQTEPKHCHLQQNKNLLLDLIFQGSRQVRRTKNQKKYLQVIYPQQIF